MAAGILRFKIETENAWRTGYDAVPFLRHIVVLFQFDAIHRVLSGVIPCESGRDIAVRKNHKLLRRFNMELLILP